MLNTIKWLNAGTVRGLLLAIIPILVLLAGMFGIDESVFKATLDGWAEKLVALVGLVAALWALIERTIKATPPLTETAAIATDKMLKKEGKTVVTEEGVAVAGVGVQTAEAVAIAIENPSGVPMPKQNGNARVDHMVAVFCGALCIAAALLSGCAGTRAAYREAKTVDETAYVALEQYAASLKESADLASKPTTPIALKNAMKSTAAIVQPIALRTEQFRKTWSRLHDAQSKEELQKATDELVLALAEFVRAVKAARGT